MSESKTMTMEELEKEGERLGVPPVDLRSFRIPKPRMRSAFPAFGPNFFRESESKRFWHGATNLIQELRQPFEAMLKGGGPRPTVHGATIVKATDAYRPMIYYSGGICGLPTLNGAVAAMVFCDLIAEELFKRWQWGFYRYLWADPEKEDHRFNCSKQVREFMRGTPFFASVRFVMNLLDQHVKLPHEPIIHKELQKLIDDVKSGAIVVEGKRGRPKGAKNSRAKVPFGYERLNSENENEHRHKLNELKGDGIRMRRDIGVFDNRLSEAEQQLAAHSEQIARLVGAVERILDRIGRVEIAIRKEPEVPKTEPLPTPETSAKADAEEDQPKQTPKGVPFV